MNINIRILNFLSELKENNNKEWFDKNRSFYKELRELFIEQTGEMINEIANFEPVIRFENPRKSIFRINRDIRFSKDKSPYKSNFGAIIAPGGKKSGNAGYYFHLEPENSFVAGGIYRPQAPDLMKIRWTIFENSEEFLKIINNKKFIETFGSIVGEKLKNPPRGFDKNFEHIELLKFKDFTVFKKLSLTDLKSQVFVSNISKYYLTIFNFNNFINKALEQ